MKINNFKDRMLIIYNVLFYICEKVFFGKFYFNVGGIFIKKMGVLVNSDVIVIDIILLDDFLDLYKFKGCCVVIKMDVEMFEVNVLKGVFEFFNNVCVEFVLMEFMVYKGKESGDFIV